MRFAEKNLPQGKRVFFIYTYGAEKKGYTDAVKQITDLKGAQVLGAYGCFGFNTFGPFKLIGGLAKGHPNDEDITGAVKFFNEINKK